VIAFALGHPGLGARRISAELARPKWGGIRISEHGVWRVLQRFNLNTRAKRLALIARHADPYEHRPPSPPPERHIDASEPGEKVGMDCFYVGRLSGAKGTVWQYTAIDVASGFAWSELHASDRNPRSCPPDDGGDSSLLTAPRRLPGTGNQRRAFRGSGPNRSMGVTTSGNQEPS
jgi:hypothetical protein